MKMSKLSLIAMAGMFGSVFPSMLGGKTLTRIKAKKERINKDEQSFLITQAKIKREQKYCKLIANGYRRDCNYYRVQNGSNENRFYPLHAVSN